MKFKEIIISIFIYSFLFLILYLGMDIIFGYGCDITVQSEILSSCWLSNMKNYIIASMVIVVIIMNICRKYIKQKEVNE